MSVYVCLSVCMSACLLRKVGADSFVRICGRVGISQEKRVHPKLLAGEEGVTSILFLLLLLPVMLLAGFYFPLLLNLNDIFCAYVNFSSGQYVFVYCLRTLLRRGLVREVPLSHELK